MRITIFGWLRLLLFATGAFYLWRSALSKADNAIRQSSRALRLIGATLLSAFLIYFVGLSLGLYRLFN